MSVLLGANGEPHYFEALQKHEGIDMSDDEPNGSGNRRAAGIGSWGTVQWDDGAVSTERPEFALEGHADEV